MYVVSNIQIKPNAFLKSLLTIKNYPFLIILLNELTLYCLDLIVTVKCSTRYNSDGANLNYLRARFRSTNRRILLENHFCGIFDAVFSILGFISTLRI